MLINMLDSNGVILHNPALYQSHAASNIYESNNHAFNHIFQESH